MSNRRFKVQPAPSILPPFSCKTSQLLPFTGAKSYISALSNAGLELDSCIFVHPCTVAGAAG